MHYPIYKILGLCLLIGFIACGTDVATESTEATQPTLVQEPSKKTQALILTQPFEFDPSDKNKMTGNYIAKKQLDLFGIDNQ